MKLYLTISAGEGGVNTTPIVASSDPKVIEAAVQELINRLQGQPSNSRSALRLVNRSISVDHEGLKPSEPGPPHTGPRPTG